MKNCSTTLKNWTITLWFLSDFVSFLIFWRSGCQTLPWFQPRKRCEYYSGTFNCSHRRSGKNELVYKSKTLNRVFSVGDHQGTSISLVYAGGLFSKRTLSVLVTLDDQKVWFMIQKVEFPKGKPATCSPSSGCLEEDLSFPSLQKYRRAGKKR